MKGPGPPPHAVNIGAEGNDKNYEPELAATAGAQDVLSKLLVQQTAILDQLAAATQRRADPLHLLGVRDPRNGGSAAPPRTVLTPSRSSSPEGERALGPSPARDMYLHFQEVVLLGNYRTLTYLAFLLAEMWQAAASCQRGRAHETRLACDVLGGPSLRFGGAEEGATERFLTRSSHILDGWRLSSATSRTWTPRRGPPKPTRPPPNTLPRTPTRPRPWRLVSAQAFSRLFGWFSDCFGSLYIPFEVFG